MRSWLHLKAKYDKTKFQSQSPVSLKVTHSIYIWWESGGSKIQNENVYIVSIWYFDYKFENKKKMRKILKYSRDISTLEYETWECSILLTYKFLETTCEMSITNFGDFGWPNFCRQRRWKYFRWFFVEFQLTYRW